MNRTSDISGMIKHLSLVLLVLLSLCCCNNPSTPKQSETEDSIAEHQIINGVERSELALLMRMMYDELLLLKDTLKQGKNVHPQFLETFKHIHDAKATEPYKIDATYHLMADAFIERYAAFESTDSNTVETFNIMVQSCLACHQSKCPGPVKAIRKLALKPD